MASNNDNNNKNRDKHLFYLNELSDYKVSSDYPDVRGWKVKDVDNRVIGKVDNLLVNKQTERVVYLDVEVDKSIIEADHDPYKASASEGVHEFINKDGENHIIIPIGLVNISENDDDKFVYTDKVNHRTFAETKRFEKGSNVNREYEVVVLESYNRDTNYSGDQQRNSGDRNTITGDHDRDRDRNTLSGDRHRNEDRETKLTGDTVTGRNDRRGEDLGDTDVSRTNSTIGHNRDRGSDLGKINDDDDYSDSKRTNFATETDGDSDLGNSRSNSSRRDYENDEDFYKRREFDDSNYRRRR